MGGNRADPLHDRHHCTFISCDKACGGAVCRRGAASLSPYLALCADTGIWEAAFPLYI